LIKAVLDTNILVHLLRQHPPAVNWFQGLGKQQLALTPIVWIETVRGARNTSERAQIIRFLRQFYIEHPTIDDNNWAMLQFSRFFLSHGTDFEDVLIASVAVRLSVPLYTLNIRHFAPLPDVDERKPY